jgi:addiction module HigA family antidote
MTITRPSAGWNIHGSTTHPGIILEEDFLKPLGITRNSLAMETRVPANRIGGIVRGTRAITPETALRLARFFGNSPEFWLNLQQMYDLSNARARAAEKVEKEVSPFSLEAREKRKRSLNSGVAIRNPSVGSGAPSSPRRRRTA